MKLVLHQFRTDLLRLRSLLFFWIPLLALDIVVSLGWLGSPANPRENAFQILFSMLPPGLVGAIVFVLLQGIAMVMLADSPINPEGFMATRPLPWRTWLAAKALFIAVCLVFPVILQELIHLVLAGLPAQYILHGTVERLLYVLPIYAITAGVAALAHRLKEFYWLGFAAAGITYLLGILAVLISQVILRSHWPDDNYIATRFLVFLYALAVGALVAASLARCLRWRRKLRFAVVSTASVLALAAAVVCPANWFAPAPAAPATVAQLAQQAPLRVPLRSLQFQTAAARGHPHRISASVRLDCELPLTNSIIRWQNQSSRLAGAGRDFPADRRNRRADEIFPYVHHYSQPELRILAQLAPPGVRLELDAFNAGGPESCWIGNFDLPSPVGSLNEKIRVQSGFEGHVFQWEKAGELDLIAGAKSRDAFGQWRIAALGDGATPTSGSYLERVQLERRQINLSTTRDQRAQTTRIWPADRYDFLLFDPARNVVRTLQQRGAWGNSWFGHTAYSTHVLNLYFRDRQPPEGQSGVINDGDPLDPPRLLIFRRVYLGTIRQSWTSPEVVLSEMVRPTSNYAAPRGQVSRADFLRLAGALPAPDPSQATDTEVRRYLAECGRLMRSSNRQHEPQNRLVISLAAYVPAHLPVFLEAVERESGYYGQWLRAAVQRGAEESQKGLIIAALRRNPDLADIVANRGWLEEARPELVALLESPRQLPYTCWRAAAWFADPKTYPLFLEHLEFNPDTWFYDLVRVLPGIEPALDQVVDRLVRRLPMTVNPAAEVVAPTSLLTGEDGFALRSYPGLEVAVRHGRPEALSIALQLLQTRTSTSREFSHEVVELLRRNVALDTISSDKRWDDKIVGKWLAAHPAGDFHFDAVRRKFVLGR